MTFLVQRFPARWFELAASAAWAEHQDFILLILIELAREAGTPACRQLVALGAALNTPE
jgi:hypothetical protein